MAKEVQYANTMLSRSAVVQGQLYRGVITLQAVQGKEVWSGLPWLTAAGHGRWAGSPRGPEPAVATSWCRCGLTEGLIQSVWWQTSLSQTQSVCRISQCVHCRSQNVGEGQVYSYQQYKTMIPTRTGTLIRLYKKNLLVIILFVSKKWVGLAVVFFFFFFNWYECGSEDKDFLYLRTCI